MRPVAHLANLDLNLLVALRELVRERSVTRAAQRLGVTQPAASAALSRLRRHFGDDLLVREHGEYVLTALICLGLLIALYIVMIIVMLMGMGPMFATAAAGHTPDFATAGPMFIVAMIVTGCCFFSNAASCATTSGRV